MKSRRMFLIAVGSLVELAGMVLIVLSFTADLSIIAGVAIIILGTGMTIAGIMSPPAKDEKPGR